MFRIPFLSVAFMTATFAAPYAQAVSLNPRGLGEVLIYPYYTVNKGQDTLISIGNASQYGKRIGVTIREGMNGRPVLDFHLYLSPFDVWTARVSAADDDGGAFLVTDDTSCTWPVTGKEATAFRAEAYTGGSVFPGDGGPASVTRTREGTIEFVETGWIAPGSALEESITHVQTGIPDEGVPACDPQQLGQSPGNDLLAPSGGLFGSATIVNVGEGTFFGYNADALADFSDLPLVGGAGILPFQLLSLANSTESALGGAIAHLSNAEGKPLALDYESGVDAVNAVLMAGNLVNEYLVTSSLGANTDWIVTFPTRMLHVDDYYVGSEGARPPFANLAVAARSEVAVHPSAYDQEGYTPCFSCDIDPPLVIRTLLPWQVNALSFRDRTLGDAPSGVLGSRLATSVEPFGDAGWLRVDLAGGDGGHALRPDAGGRILEGLPVSGFMVYNIINANAAPGRLANYGGAFPHRTTTFCRFDDDFTIPRPC